MKEECEIWNKRCGRLAPSKTLGRPQPCVQGLIWDNERIQKRVFECALYPKSEPFIPREVLGLSLKFALAKRVVKK
jgi:hypothetical protein